MTMISALSSSLWHRAAHEAPRATPARTTILWELILGSHGLLWPCGSPSDAGAERLPAWHGLHRPVRASLTLRGLKRESHAETSAIRAGAKVDFSVMPFDDDPVTDHQAESGA
jgi:hypothetical protein